MPASPRRTSAEWSRGGRTNAKIETIAAIAAVFGVTVNDLLINPTLDDALPKYHVYVSRKFAGDPRLQKALLLAYKAIISVREEIDAEEGEDRDQAASGA